MARKPDRQIMLFTATHAIAKGDVYKNTGWYAEAHPEYVHVSIESRSGKRIAWEHAPSVEAAQRIGKRLAMSYSQAMGHAIAEHAKRKGK